MKLFSKIPRWALKPTQPLIQREQGFFPGSEESLELYLCSSSVPSCNTYTRTMSPFCLLTKSDKICNSDIGHDLKGEVLQENTLFWDVMLWNLVEIYTRFKRRLCFHLKGRRLSFPGNGSIKFPQTLVSLYQATWHHNPSGSMLHCYFFENFRSHRRKAWSILVYSDAWVKIQFPWEHEDMPCVIIWGTWTKWECIKYE